MSVPQVADPKTQQPVSSTPKNYAIRPSCGSYLPPYACYSDTWPLPGMQVFITLGEAY